MTTEKLQIVIEVDSKNSAATIKMVEDGLKATGVQAEIASARLNTAGMTAKQMSASLRMLPAQFTDIFVGLASGQTPMMVLLQQGGQLKDMFGGVGNALREMGKYVFSLINPTSLLISGIASLGYAAYKHFTEAEEAARKFYETQQRYSGQGLIESLEKEIDLLNKRKEAIAQGIPASATNAQVEELLRLQGVISSTTDSLAKFQEAGMMPTKESDREVGGMLLREYNVAVERYSNLLNLVNEKEQAILDLRGEKGDKAAEEKARKEKEQLDAEFEAARQRYLQEGRDKEELLQFEIDWYQRRKEEAAIADQELADQYKLYLDKVTRDTENAERAKELIRAQGRANTKNDFSALGEYSKAFMVAYKAMAISEILGAGSVRAEKSAAWASWGGPHAAAAAAAVSWAATLANAAAAAGFLGGGGGGGGGNAAGGTSASSLSSANNAAAPSQQQIQPSFTINVQTTAGLVDPRAAQTLADSLAPYITNSNYRGLNSAMAV